MPPTVPKACHRSPRRSLVDIAKGARAETPEGRATRSPVPPDFPEEHINMMISVTREEFWEMCPSMATWVKFRDECDPVRVFVNNWLERNVLGEEEGKKEA